MMIVHFAVKADGEVRPLCGEWGGVHNWTKIESAVSCPRCLARLAHEGVGTRRDRDRR